MSRRKLSYGLFLISYLFHWFMATFFKCIFDLFSGKRLTVWNRTWSVLSLRCDILDSTCCPLSQYTQRCALSGWGRALSDLADAASSSVVVALPKGWEDLVAWLSEGDKGKRNSIFQGYGLSPRGFSSHSRHLLWLGKACIWMSYQSVHPSNSVGWYRQRANLPFLPQLSPLWSHLCPRLPSEGAV